MFYAKLQIFLISALFITIMVIAQILVRKYLNPWANNYEGSFRKISCIIVAWLSHTDR